MSVALFVLPPTARTFQKTSVFKIGLMVARAGQLPQPQLHLFQKAFARAGCFCPPLPRGREGVRGVQCMCGITVKGIFDFTAHTWPTIPSYSWSLPSHPLKTVPSCLRHSSPATKSLIWAAWGENVTTLNSIIDQRFHQPRRVFFTLARKKQTNALCSLV